MASSSRQFSEEQLALSIARQQQKLRVSLTPPVPPPVSKVPLVNRQWVGISQKEKDAIRPTRLMTWNMLAQTLVRRDLFPTSNCLKATQREGMLVTEILTYNPDILCLQEVDRLEKLVPTLEAGSYKTVYGSGPGKRHGCMVVYRDSIFQIVDHTVIEYDKLQVHEAGDERQCIGSTRSTKNIGLIVALSSRDDPSKGYIVATTHLFWHPSFTYERTRQAGLLTAEASRFRETRQLTNWPCIIAGDFNFPPSDPAYAFLTGDSITPLQEKAIQDSRVIHISIDPSIVPENLVPAKDDEEGVTAVDPDRVITNSRHSTADDRLLSDAELRDIFRVGGGLRSIYDDGQRRTSQESVFGTRMPGYSTERKGFFEPIYTSYTHFWKATLDYMFLLENFPSQMEVVGFMKVPKTEEMEPGLPQKGICGSDHVSLVADVITTWDEQAT